MGNEEDNVAQTDSEDTPETIAKAKEMGWVSPDEWRGDPPKNGFRGAAEYVKNSERVMPLINARARKAEERVAALETELNTTRAEHTRNLDRIERMSRATLENQRSQIEAEYEAKKTYAVETGDRATYQALVKQEKEVTKAFDERAAEVEKPKPKAGDDQPGIPKEVKATLDTWFADNPWYHSDGEMNALATAVHNRLMKERSGLTLAENLAEVRNYIKKKFPDKFGAAEEEGEDDPPARGSRVEGSARTGGGRQTQWSRVPPENRKIAENAGHISYYLESGETMEKNKTQAQERWATKYFEGEA